MATRKPPKPPASAESYRHPEGRAVLRPDVGTQAQFKKTKPPVTFRYDSSLSPALEWDGQNPPREVGEALIKAILDAETIDEAKAAATKLAAMSKPFLDWAGKAERLSFDVPTLPLFVHERLSTKAILETLKGHARDKQLDLLLFNDPHASIRDQVFGAYEHPDKWMNRLILGDSLVVMNSLVQYEGMRGQVQMIYMDPPYGVSFGSNFQPFVRKREVKHGDDESMTREPETVQAYRDTWELGVHSYLTYLRDRLVLARDLLAETGSIFVQISDDNLHHVRELLDEVFGRENFVVIVCYRRLGSMVGKDIVSSAHYLVWYAKEKERAKIHKLFIPQVAGTGTGDHYTQVEHKLTHETRPMIRAERSNPSALDEVWRPFQLVSLATGGYRPNTTVNFKFDGRTYHPGPNKCWRTTLEGLARLVEKRRIARAGETVRYKQYLDDFPLTEVTTIWDDTARDPENSYVVQTPSNIIERCLLMTTDPGDLVFDPTCGSGTTAYVAEQWGRRWISTDVSRVPLALARQRLLTATYPWYDLKDEGRGPASGFVYKRKQNARGEEVGGIVPHITLGSIANNEPPKEEVLVDRPEKSDARARVTGPFSVEATIPAAADWDDKGDGKSEPDGSAQADRMLEVLRRSPVLHLPKNRTVTFENVRPPAKSLVLSAEAIVKNGEDRRVAFVFGPESGAVSEKLVFEAAREARMKGYAHLYVIGFAVEPNARALVEHCEQVADIAATYVQATPDLLMGGLLKNMRSSQIFSVCGLPEIAIERLEPEKKGGADRFAVRLVGLDTFDPISMQSEHRPGNDVPAWLLDTDYNGLCFHVSQAFFPRTSAWDHLKRALKGEMEESVWQHLAGTTSAPFEAGEQATIAVKVIDDRGNELVVVEKLPRSKR
jgi:adenine-specific DNA-methyltransferase